MRDHMSTRTELDSATSYTDDEGNTRTQRVEGTLSNFQKEDRSEGPDVRLSFPDSPIESESFDYSAPQLAIESFEADVDAALRGEGLSVPDSKESVPDDSNRASPEEGISLTEAVRELASRVAGFFRTWFGVPAVEAESSGDELSDQESDSLDSQPDGASGTNSNG
jgi:hypothetical protein